MAFPTQIFSNKEEEAQRQGGYEEEVERGTPVKYVPLCDVYSATSPSSKKVKARKLPEFHCPDHHKKHKSSTSRMVKPPVTHFYSRRRKRNKPSLLDSSRSNAQPPPIVVKSENFEFEEGEEKEEDDPIRRLIKGKKNKKRKIRSNELINLGVDSSMLSRLNGPRLRENRNYSNNNNNFGRRRKCAVTENEPLKENSGSIRTKRWVWLSFDGIDPKKFIGLQCKVYWPLDADWYSGRIVGYDLATDRHHIEYEDGDEEKLILANERIKFYLAAEDMQRLKLSYSLKGSEADGLAVNEMVALAASLDDFHELEAGDIIWAKITGTSLCIYP
ncbi:unnamed protein product [Ilex paraguariensis]|uniref:Histone-lysine N-methyltransferase ATX2 n=1 Tax=Ilex paraguariensis TaxID=185542 RepID=A0ABC8TE94_9AQUA